MDAENAIDPMDFIDDITSVFNGRSDSTLMQRLQLDGEISRLNLIGATEHPLLKAITTGNGAVTPTDTGGKALRNEFLHGALSNETFSDRHAGTFNAVKKVPVKNTAIQWVAQGDLGYEGDGFIDEKGADGLFNGDVESDADYRREIENVAFIHDVRQTGFITQQVENQVNPVEDGRKAAVRVIKARANRNLHFGDRRLNALESNGIVAQILAECRRNPTNRIIMMDAGGYRLEKPQLEEACRILGDQYANPTMQIMSNLTHADIQVSLFPQQRSGDPLQGAIGVNANEFVNPYNDGPLKFMRDPMLRANRPLSPQGPGQDGKPRDFTTASRNCLVWTSSPFAGGGAVAAGAAGTDYYFNNVTYNDMTGPIGTSAGTTPAVPAGTDSPGTGNQLKAGTYYYGVSIVYLGRESPIWINGVGASGAGSIGTGVNGDQPVGTAVTLGQVVKLTLNVAAVTGIGTNFNRNRIRFRVYRADAAPTKVTDFVFLCETGTPTAGNSVAFDNGMYIPGCSDSFVISESDEDGLLFFWAQLLPLLKRELPHKLLSDLYGYLLFGTPILKKRGRHIWWRNVGRLARP